MTDRSDQAAINEMLAGKIVELQRGLRFSYWLLLCSWLSFALGELVFRVWW